jgi:hypothetical protein
MAAFPEQFKTLMQLIVPQLSARAVLDDHTAQAIGPSALEPCWLSWNGDAPGGYGHFQLELSLPNAYMQGSLSKMCGGEVSSIGWQGLAHNTDCSISQSIKMIL